MDLVTLGPRASAEERAAVDGVLGLATSRWEGGDRSVPGDDRFSRGGHAARARRDLLLPVFHAIQDRIGWISQPALEYACRRLSVPPAEAYGVAAFYQLFSTLPRPPVVAHVCEDVACRVNGAEDLCADLERALGPAGRPALGGEDRPGRPAVVGEHAQHRVGEGGPGSGAERCRRCPRVSWPPRIPRQSTSVDFIRRPE